jgi:oligo-1,6-glucosidase
MLSHLDYLAQLGVDVVWLSPVLRLTDGRQRLRHQRLPRRRSDLRHSDDLDQLIAGLHERGIKIVMDLVVNHTSDEHPWFIEARDPASSKRDWFWWRPAKARI